MNYLAHMFLSCNDEELLIGNFIADSIRNRDLVLYNSHIQNGVKLHRHIDSFTDHHSVVIESTKIFHENHGKYAPVVIDVCYDYVLAKNWEKYEGQSLQSFAGTVYHILLKHKSLFSEHVATMTEKMIEGNFLLQYGEERGIRNTFARIERRAKFSGNWSKAFDDLIDNYDTIEKGFNIFFPEMIESVQLFCNCD